MRQETTNLYSTYALLAASSPVGRASLATIRIKNVTFNHTLLDIDLSIACLRTVRPLVNMLRLHSSVRI